MKHSSILSYLKVFLIDFYFLYLEDKENRNQSFKFKLKFLVLLANNLKKRNIFCTLFVYSLIRNTRQTVLEGIFFNSLIGSSDPILFDS